MSPSGWFGQTLEECACGPACACDGPLLSDAASDAGYPDPGTPAFYKLFPDAPPPEFYKKYPLTDYGIAQYKRDHPLEVQGTIEQQRAAHEFAIDMTERHTEALGTATSNLFSTMFGGRATQSGDGTYEGRYDPVTGKSKPNPNRTWLDDVPLWLKVSGAAAALLLLSR